MNVRASSSSVQGLWDKREEIHAKYGFTLDVCFLLNSVWTAAFFIFLSFFFSWYSLSLSLSLPIYSLILTTYCIVLLLQWHIHIIALRFLILTLPTIHRHRLFKWWLSFWNGLQRQTTNCRPVATISVQHTLVSMQEAYRLSPSIPIWIVSSNIAPAQTNVFSAYWCTLIACLVMLLDYVSTLSISIAWSLPVSWWPANSTVTFSLPIQDMQR